MELPVSNDGPGRESPTMKRVYLLILGMCILTSRTAPGFAEKPMRLFFEKSIPSEYPDGQEHTVQKGEWLVRILTNKGYSSSQIHGLLPTVQQLNPHIPDLNTLRPGQIILLPGHVAPASAPKQPSPALTPPDSYTRLPYIVRSGDTLTEILESQGVSKELIFSSYMPLFLELNPDVRNPDLLRVGQHISVPVPKAQASARPADTAARTPPKSEPSPLPYLTVRKSSSSGPGTNSPEISRPSSPMTPQAEPIPPSPIETATVNPTKSEDLQTRTPVLGLTFVRSMLEQMRFSFTPGDEAMYPVPGKGWLRIKMPETPLLETPWGGKVILCPVPKSSEWISDANTLGMRVCSVSPSWSLREVLQKLAASFPNNFRLWAADRDLVLSRNGLSMSLRSPLTAIIEYSGQKNVYVIWSRQAAEAPLPQNLPEILEPSRIKIIELDEMNELSRLPARPRESIYVPVATHLDVIRAMNPENPEELFGQTLPENMASLLQLLRDKDMLRQGMAQASWAGGVDRRIEIQIPAWTIAPSAHKIALLDRRFSDEYLVSVLSQYGYHCFILHD